MAKRKYEKKLLRRIGAKENQDFLLAHLRREWEATERAIAKDQRKRKFYDIAQKTGAALGFTILGMAAVCGVLFVGAIAPNIFSVFSHFGKHRRYFNKKDFRGRMYYLQRRGYIDVEREGPDAMQIKLTDLGKAQVVKRVLGEVRIVPQEKWDGLWRVVSFDIPERNRWARVGVRESLKRMGFYRLQKSTFVFPYPCRDEVEFLTRLYDVCNAIRFIETSSISTDDDIKTFFFPHDRRRGKI